MPPAGQANACRALIAGLPDDLVPHQHRHGGTPTSPYLAAFGTPAVVVSCGVPVPKHDPTTLVLEVDGVDWLQLGGAGRAERYLSFHSRVVVEVVVPHAYLPADILPVLSPLVGRAGPGHSA